MTRPFFAEVVREGSASRCGVAALRCVLAGYGIDVGDEELAALSQQGEDKDQDRDQDQDAQAVADMAKLVGLDVALLSLPVDYFCEEHLPAVVLFGSEEARPHFVVVWSQVGPLFQVMDPQLGLRWLTKEGLRKQLYLSERVVEAQRWREEAAEEPFCTSLRSRLSDLELAPDKVEALMSRALADPSWQGLAALDAATRMASDMVQAGALWAGNEAQELLERLLADVQAPSEDVGAISGTAPDVDVGAISRSRPDVDVGTISGTPPDVDVGAISGSRPDGALPRPYWSVVPHKGERAEEGWLLWRGVHVLQLLRGQTQAKPAISDDDPKKEASTAQTTPSELTLWHYLEQDGLLTPALLSMAAALSAGGVIFQVLLFYAFLQLGQFLSTPFERLVAISLLFFFVLTLPLLQWPTYLGALRLGRRLESRLRMAMLEKSAHLSGRYFQDQSIADLTERVHSVSEVRYMPLLGLKVIQLFFESVLTLVGIAIIDLPSLFFALLTLSGVGIWVVIAPTVLSARYLRLRDYLGRLSRFYLDGLLGVVAIRTHGAEKSVEHEHQGLLIKWAQDKLSLHRVEFFLSNVDIFVFWTALGSLVLSYVARGGDMPSLLLLLYWAFRLAYIIEELLPTYSEYFSQESKAQRFLEPLKVPNQEVGIWIRSDDFSRSGPGTTKVVTTREKQGVKIELREVNVQIASNRVLSDINLTIEPGEQLAIVGASGAGKSTFVGLLLGWHEDTTGQILIDGRELKEGLAQLWRETAWVDPAIQLWNRSLLDNLKYGGSQTPLAMVIEQADLMNILERLPDGLNTRLGEGGRLVSGGQGQRVRFGRALGRKTPRFVILDEPFRGLDRDKRRTLMARARAFWGDATLICVTHDVSLTNTFDRVLVVHAGRIVEDDAPHVLVTRPHSRYNALLQAEEAVREGLFTSNTWRRLWLEGGQLSSRSEPATKERAKPPRATPYQPPLDSPSSDNFPTWSLAEVGEAIRLLAQKNEWPFEQKVLLPAFQGQAADEWIDKISNQLQLESQMVSVSYEEVEKLLKKGGPALLRLPNQRFVALLNGGWNLPAGLSFVSVIGPTGAVQRVNSTLLRDALCRPLEAPFEAQIEHFFTKIEGKNCGLRIADCGMKEVQNPRRSELRKSEGKNRGLPIADRGMKEVRNPQFFRAGGEKARRAMLRSQLKESPIGGVWLLHVSQGADFWAQIKLAKLPTYLSQAIALRLLNRLSIFASWGVIGYMALLSHPYMALILAWLLLLLSIMPSSFARIWIEKRFAVATGILFRERLFYGALNLSPDEIQHKGAGQFLGWVIDSEAVEQAILIQTPGVIRAAVELLIALLLLAISIPLAALCLVGWLLITGVVSWRFFHHERRWKAHYSEMTNNLVERMMGHQTRLVQEPRSEWHQSEDQALAHYESLSKKRDHFEARLVAFIPYGWLVMGLVGVSYSFVTQPETVTLAISFLAILTAFQALKDLSLKLSGVVRGMASYADVQPILQAAGGQDKAKATNPPQGASLRILKKQHKDRAETKGKVIIDARKLTFRYRPHSKPILRQCKLQIHAGDRLLLEGPSGGGKSTLAALLAGLRQPNSGMILLHGLDWHTVGSETWRQRIVYAPQFHENHILSGTLAFNLLMGRGWPASQKDLADAETICRELGLGPLLDKMPQRLQQPVGESGWHLSHGERSRIYIARALLQQADLVILDESFGSLDPQNMETALRTVLKRAPTLLVIAHP
ncbi:MAG: ATP-binding cassette domain-containing protein [Ardenticatenaceae bacterium]